MRVMPLAVLLLAVSGSARVLRASSRNSPGYVSTQEREKEMYAKMGEETKGCPKDLFRSSRNAEQYTPASKWTDWMRASTGPAVSALVARRQAENASTPIRVFECGCGAGGALSTIPRLFPEQKFALNGIDFSAPQVEVAQRCLPAGSTVATGNCSDLHGRVASSSADVVLSIGSGFRAVASMADAKNQLSELLRVASPGAVVAITHVVMPAGDSRSEPQCTDPQDTGFQIPHKWWADELKALGSNRAVHFIDDPQYRANEFEKFKCRYSVWIDRKGSLEG